MKFENERGLERWKEKAGARRRGVSLVRGRGVHARHRERETWLLIHVDPTPLRSPFSSKLPRLDWRLCRPDFRGSMGPASCAVSGGRPSLSAGWVVFGAVGGEVSAPS